MHPVVVLVDMVQSVVKGEGVGSGNPNFYTDTDTGTGQITKIQYLIPDLNINGSTHRARVAASLRPPPPGKILCTPLIFIIALT